MIDYAQTAETLHAMIGDVDELYHHAVAPRNKQALTAAAALCEAHAAPVDEAKVAEAWQPIESAPKDRKARLVYVPDNKCIYEVYWDEVRLMWITFGGGCVLPYEPTHWQPLPPPPTVEGERG